ncbi:hypothetical protein [Pontibacter burrus]|uniref:Uncharacterized protein n=1 Tax=Pontibacter burrus TaxID=2704466 RepID=A0A6B3LJL5_9BACT|nr:hypothetical protein [Pontibacter burrus]NEM96163.1 hypothetical protein [Pontibacter burrus]
MLPDGTYLRDDCNGTTRQQVVANGSGGERWGAVIEVNSTLCGYVVRGCMDPEAQNYNPDAVQDDGSCTYAPKAFTEVKVIDVLPCADGVCLRWYNSLGGIDTWHFTGKVDKPFTSEASGEYTLANGLKAAASKAGNPGMVLRTSGLNYNRYTALWQLYTSPKVWIHHPDGSTEEVYVQPANLAPMPLGRTSYDLVVEVVKAPLNTLRN